MSILKKVHVPHTKCKITRKGGTCSYTHPCVWQSVLAIQYPWERVDLMGSTVLAYDVLFRLPSQQGVRQTAILVILTHTHGTEDTRSSKLLARVVPTCVYTLP